MTRAAKIYQLDGRAFRIYEENVLRFEIAVNNLEIRSGEEFQCGAQLLGKFAREIERDSTEVSIAKEVVEIVRKQLKDQAEMTTEHEVGQQPNCD